MKSSSILAPLLAQVLLTFTVWLRLLYGRYTIVKKLKINPQRVANESEAKKIYASIENISDNFENLFELPVLFYIASLILLITEQNNFIYLLGAWGFVGFRVLHSLVHCTSNRILYRFSAFVASSVFLWIIWGRIVFYYLG